jgi:hypothetical protein
MVLNACYKCYLKIWHGTHLTKEKENIFLTCIQHDLYDVCNCTKVGTHTMNIKTSKA